MNILTDKLPESVILNGKAYRINGDFKTAVSILSYGENNKGVKLLMFALKKFYKDLPEDINDAIEGMKKFYGVENSNPGNEERIFSFDTDSDLIFSSFYSKYNINLAEDDLHWYVFLALLKGLCGDNAFSKVLEIRRIDISEIKDVKQKQKMQLLKQKYSLSGKLTIDEGLRSVF